MRTVRRIGDRRYPGEACLRLRHGASFVLLLLALSPGSHAENRPPLTRDELGACRATDRALKGKDAGVATARAAIDSDLVALQKQQADITARGAALDDTEAAAVQAYNTLIDAHQQQADAFNAKVAALNEDVAALNAARADYDRECAGRAYDAEDLEAIEGRAGAGD